MCFPYILPRLGLEGTATGVAVLRALASALTVTHRQTIEVSIHIRCSTSVRISSKIERSLCRYTGRSVTKKVTSTLAAYWCQASISTSSGILRAQRNANGARGNRRATSSNLHGEYTKFVSAHLCDFPPPRSRLPFTNDDNTETYCQDSLRSMRRGMFSLTHLDPFIPRHAEIVGHSEKTS